jgi:hypothetical protein
MLPADDVKLILEKSNILIDEIRKIPPDISVSTFIERIDKLREMPMNWKNEDDRSIYKELRSLSAELDRMRRLKSGNLVSFPQELQHQILELLHDMRKAGVFLVPVGELENWLASEGIKESKTKKATWANAAALKIQSKGPSDGDIWNFLRDVGRYLEQAYKTTTVAPDRGRCCISV